MSGLKTIQTDDSVLDFINSIEHETRKKDAQYLLDLYSRVTNETPKMWGSSIVGFGEYQYTNAKGEKLSWMKSAFSPRKQFMSLYLMAGIAKHPSLLSKLGKHKHGKSCLNINKLADVDLDIVEQLVKADIDEMNSRYP